MVFEYLADLRSHTGVPVIRFARGIDAQEARLFRRFLDRQAPCPVATMAQMDGRCPEQPAPVQRRHMPHPQKREAREQRRAAD